VGCSAGVGTRRLADDFPAARVMGVDLSPYFLAVAEFRERHSTRCER
jgi:trans-aconitate methyltransferase